MTPRRWTIEAKYDADGRYIDPAEEVEVIEAAPVREVVEGLLEVVEFEGISLKWKNRVKAGRALLRDLEGKDDD